VTPIPGQQCDQIGDLVIGDPREHIGEPGLGIDVIELGCLNSNLELHFLQNEKGNQMIYQ
jgi:hypothetical protein